MAKIIIFNIIGLSIALGALGFLLYIMLSGKVDKYFYFEKKHNKNTEEFTSKPSIRTVHNRRKMSYVLIEDNTEETVLLCEDGTEFHCKKFIEK